MVSMLLMQDFFLTQAHLHIQDFLTTHIMESLSVFSGTIQGG